MKGLCGKRIQSVYAVGLPHASVDVPFWLGFTLMPCEVGSLHPPGTHCTLTRSVSACAECSWQCAGAVFNGNQLCVCAASLIWAHAMAMLILPRLETRIKESNMCAGLLALAKGMRNESVALICSKGNQQHAVKLFELEHAC